mgnify:CR=1 FL=1
MAEQESPFCNCLYFSANSLARCVSRIAEDAFAKTGLAPSYAYVLQIVLSKPGIAQKEIGQTMMLTPSTITRFIDKLAYKGYICRKVEGKNSYIYATSKGKSLAPELEHAMQELNDAYGKILGDTEVCELSQKIYQTTISLEPS